MLTKRLPSRLPRQLRSRTPAALRRASGLTLSLALLSQMLIFGGARAAAQSQPGFDVDEAATAQVRRLPARPAGGAAVDFSALSAAGVKGGEASASASKGGAARFVEPPPAEPEPEVSAASSVVKSQRRGKSLDKDNAVAPAAADELSAQATPFPTPDIETLPPPPDMPAQSDNGLVAPPDTNGAVGLDKVMSTTRADYVVQDKFSGAVLSSVPIEVFWAATGAAGVYNPRVIYDPYNHRWLVSAVSDARTASSSVLVGVSQTDDPAGAYYLFRFDADPEDQLWADYGTLGFNKNWAVVSFNAHNVAGDGFNQGRAFVLDYPALLSGVAVHTLFGGLSVTSASALHQPVVTYSQTEEMLYLVSHVGSGAATYRVSAVTGTPSEPVIFIGAQKSSFNFIGGWTQPGGETLPQAPGAAGARKIESPDSRVQKAVFRNGSIYYCQTVGLPAGRTAATIDRTAAQWVRLDSNADFVEGSRVEDPTATATNGGKWYAYPSLSVNQFDDVLVGFTQFASNQHPAAGYATHVGGTMPASPASVTIYKAGEGYYERLSPANRNLWGLYSNAQVDPANDRDIWTIQEYAAAPSGTGANSGRWGTWWARSPLNRPPSVSIFRPVNGATYLEPAMVELMAEAADVDGNVVSVEFFNGQTKIGDGVLTLSLSGDFPPGGTWNFDWLNVPAGTYTITARAHDDEGSFSDSAPVTVTVLPVSVLSDDFNDNSLDPAIWFEYNPGSPSQVREQNGRLEIAPNPSTVVYNGIASVNAFSFRNKTITVEVPQTTSQAGWVETYIMLWLDDNNFYQIVTGAGNLVADVMVNGAETRGVIPYNAAAHRFWRIRHNAAAHTVNFEASGDGVNWTTFRTAPVNISLDGMKFYLGAGAWGSGNSAPGTAAFDGVKLTSNE